MHILRFYFVGLNCSPYPFVSKSYLQIKYNNKMTVQKIIYPFGDNSVDVIIILSTVIHHTRMVFWYTLLTLKYGVKITLARLHSITTRTGTFVSE